MDAENSLRAAVAHSHDRTLQDFKVWRSAARLESGKSEESGNTTVNVNASGVRIGTIVTAQGGGIAAVQVPITETAVSAQMPSVDSEPAWLKTAWGKIIIGVAIGLIVLLLGFVARQLWSAFALGSPSPVTQLPLPLTTTHKQEAPPSAAPVTRLTKKASPLPGVWAGQRSADDLPIFYEFAADGIVLTRRTADDTHPAVLEHVRWSISGDKLLLERLQDGRSIETYIGSLFDDLIIGSGSSSSGTFPITNLERVRSVAPKVPHNTTTSSQDPTLQGTLERKTGTVKFFNEAKGYGIIVASDGQDVFVHYSSIKGEPRTLSPGQRVSFIPVKGPKGWQAEDVSRVVDP